MLSLKVLFFVLKSVFFFLCLAQLRQSVRRFCAEKLAPHADEIDKKNEFAGMRVSFSAFRVYEYWSDDTEHIDVTCWHAVINLLCCVARNSGKTWERWGC